MASEEILYGYQIIFEITNVNIFQFIQDQKDDFLWDRGFRPAFTEEKYIKRDEKSHIILIPTSRFTVSIEPQNHTDASKLLEEVRSLIQGIRDSVAQDVESEIKEDIKYVLVFHQTLDLLTLLPKWYVSAVDLSRTRLKEFKTFVEDMDGDKVRLTEVTLRTKEENILEIKIVSPDLELAKQLVASISASPSE